MKDLIVPLAKEYISIPSTAEDTDSLLKVLESAKKQLPEYPHISFVSDGAPSLLFSNTTEPQKEFKIILNAHLDVVPATNKAQYEPYEQDGKLYGRGAYDMKSAAAVMTLVFKELGKTLPYSLGLQLTTDEEVGGQNGTKYHLDQGVRTEFCITGEGTNLRITHAAKGILLIKLTTKGKNAHGAYPWLGKNAIWEMYEALGAIMDSYGIPEHETDATTVNLSKIETTNNAFNKVPDHCVAYLDIRYPFEEQDTIVQAIRSLVPANIAFDVVKKPPAHHTESTNPYAVLLRKTTTDVINEELPLRKAYGASDAAYFSAIGAGAVEFGPKGGNHHSENEWVDIQSLHDYYNILKNFLLSIQ